MIDFEVDGKKYKVVKPNAAQHAKANELYTREFNKLLKQGDLMVREEMMDLAKKRGLWSEAKEEEYELNLKEINRLQEKLEKGGYELEEARQDVVEIQRLRGECLVSQAVINSILDNTVEQQAISTRYNYLASVCIVDDKNKPLCKNLDEFLNSEDKALITGLTHFATLYYGTNDRKDSVDMEFVKKYGLNEEAPEEEESQEEKIESKPFLQNGKPIKDVEETVGK